jgi:hypothetical protein
MRKGKILLSNRDRQEAVRSAEPEKDRSLTLAARMRNFK